MPNCYSLTRKSAPEAGPVPLNTIDEEICKHLGVPVHLKHWCKDWHNTIGFSLAVGRSFDEQIESIEEEIKNTETDDLKDWWNDQLKILHYLRDNFVSDAWATIGRR